MRFKDLKIGTRMVAGSLVVLLLFLAGAVFAIARIAQVQSELDQIVRINDVRARLATGMYQSLQDQRIALGNMILLAGQARGNVEQVRVRADLRRLADTQDRLQAMLAAENRPDEGLLLARAKAQFAHARPLIERVLALAAAGDGAGATTVLLRDLEPVQTAWAAALRDFILLEGQRKDASLAAVDGDYRMARGVTIALVALILLAGAALTWRITASITQPIEEAVRVAETVAAGDLRSHITTATRDETGRLLAALGEMNASLARIVTRVREGTDAIALSSGRIARGNADLSARTEQQACALEETAATMDELTATVTQNADNAAQASQLAGTTSEVAVRGGRVVNQVVDTMNAIKASSGKIVDITAVIDGIAFQTNILALNAAVEAARAGEQGRGFAVVAGEVRTLAQRSAGAAREIKALIDESVANVDAGNALVEQAGVTIAEVVSSVQRLSEIVADIAAASREQSLGIVQVNQAIGQMDQVTQKNASLVEEVTAAASALNQQAAHLSQVVGAFKLAGRAGKAGSTGARGGAAAAGHAAGVSSGSMTLAKAG